MNILYLVLTIIVFIILLIVAAIRPLYSKFSMFELERRSSNGDDNAKSALAREKALSDVVSIQFSLIALLLVGVTTFAILAFSWLIGAAVALLMAISYESIARLPFLKSLSKKIYNHSEKSILHFIKKHRLFVKLFRGATIGGNSHSLQIESRDELQHLIAESSSIISPDEKKLIIHSLAFNDQLVRSIMTPRDKIVSINKSEFLGPLMLNDLHKVGHNRLPVIDGGLDRVIGILNLKDLLTLDTKKSMTAEKTMDNKVYYIREDQTLYQGLVAFSHTHQHLLIVVNEARETVGILVLEDIIEALLGRKIVDEFDDYDNLRAVATRK